MRSLLVILLVVAGAARAEEPERKVIVAANPRYAAGWIYRFFLGAHWRETWTTPVEVPVLDLGAFGGGLHAEREGGGMETKNLHLKSDDGRTWAFRSVDKDPTRMLDPDTRDSVIGDLFQDETSTAQPYGALVVPRLLDAADVLHATPRLEMMPDDPRLGEFRKFAGVLGLLEERIEHNLEGAAKTSETLELFERLEERGDERVDARAYLRARLVDLLVGDWDRHVLQWRWARYDRDGERVWEPIPRDRDQAFSRFDGVIPSLAEYYTIQVSGFGPGYVPIKKLTFAGRYTDRRFLVSLERPAWEEVTSELVAKLTDEVIAGAVRRLPSAVYEKEGEGLAQTLRARRDALPKASRDYYELLADRVDVRGTFGNEEVRIDRLPSGAVAVSLYATDGKAAPFFHRTFQPRETSQIRLYTLGGADRVRIEGSAGATIPVRVVAPPGTVEVIDRSSQPSAARVYAPLPDDPPSASTAANNDPETARLIQRYETFRDWGSDALFFPQLVYDGTRGLVAGAILHRTGYDFQLDPYSSVMNFAAAWSTGTNQPRLEYSLDLRTRSPVRGLLYLEYSGMDSVNYFGQGNETPRLPALTSTDFYQVKQKVFVANPMIELPVAGPLAARAGALFKHTSDVDGAGIIAATHPEGAGAISLGSGELGLRMDTRSGTFPHERGLAFDVIVRTTPAIFDNPSAFTKLRGQVSGVAGGHALTDFQLSARVAGEKNWGDYPFFESAFIGGVAQSKGLDVTGASIGNLLRGYDLNRFAGEASVVGNAELDVALGKFKAALPFRYGLTGLADVGRVFVAGESSSKWHTAYGGGLWLGIFASGMDFQLATALKATLVHSDEGTSVYVFTGFNL